MQTQEQIDAFWSNIDRQFAEAAGRAVITVREERLGAITRGVEAFIRDPWCVSRIIRYRSDEMSIADIITYCDHRLSIGARDIVPLRQLRTVCDDARFVEAWKDFRAGSVPVAAE